VSQSSAQRKLARGIEQVYALSRETGDFEHAHAYVPDVKRKIRSPKEVEYKITAIENARPKEDWPLLAGEAIQNLRAALDHAVYAASANKYRRSSQFPIFTDPCEFQVKGRPLIAGVPKAIRALIENAQPYKRLPLTPALSPLAVLSSLSNRDKHRTLSTVVTSVRFQYVSLGEGIQIEAIKPFREGEPLHYGAEIAHFIARSESEITEVDVNPRFVYEVRIEGRPLLSTLGMIVVAVSDAVTECETGQPIEPLAQL